MSKKCIKCGAELAENASFCPHCETKQSEPVVVKKPKIWRRATVTVVAIAAVAALVYFAISLYHAPKTYNGSAELFYTDKNATYRLVLAFQNSLLEEKQPEEIVYRSAGPNETFCVPSQLAVYNETTGELANEEFLEKIDYATVLATPLNTDSREMSTTEPHTITDVFPTAALVSDIEYYGYHGDNDVKWTIHMKNGDTLTLHHGVSVTLIEEVNYSYSDTPLDTYDDLVTLIREIEEQLSGTTVVNVYLPPVTYSGPLTLSKRAINFYGSSEGSNKTTFTSGIAVNSESPSITLLSDICFVGDGSGTAVQGNMASAGIENCEFENWDVGVEVNDGSWIFIDDCTFTNNEIGYRMNSHHSQYSIETHSENKFINNGTAVLLEKIPSDRAIDFNDCVFTGNTTDIDNRTNNPIATTNSTFD